MFNKLIGIIFIVSSSIFAQNNSYFFNSGDYVECTVDMSEGAEELLQPTEGVTVEAWVKNSFSGTIENFTGIAHYLTLNGPTDESGFALMYYENAWRFVVSVTGDNDIFGSGLEVWPGIELDEDEWDHVAGTYDNATGEAKIYLNGSLQETHSTGGGDIDWEDIDVKLLIGRGTTNASEFRYMEGAIDEVRVWSIARTQADIQTDMYQVIGAVDNLEAYWNFNDNQSTTVSDQTGNGYNGALDESGSGDWHDDVFTEVSGDCEDYVISELPFYHSDTTTGQGDDWNSENYNDSLDIAYKLTLSEQRTLYIDTCDSLTNFDTILSIKSACNDDNSIIEHDDGPTGWCTEVDTLVLPSQYPSIIDTITLAPGTYYIVVDGYSPAAHGTYGLAVGAIPEIISSTIASDDSYIEIRFNDPIYTESNGTGAANLADFDITFNQNGGNASNVQIASMTNVDGGSLAGGEDTIRFNISVTGISSGVETVTINPASSSSVFNSFGIGLSSESSVTQNLNDYFPPVINFNPTDGDTIWPSEDLVIDFGETIILADGSNANDTNIDEHISLKYTSSQQDIPFDATISDADSKITVNPNNNLTELSNVEVSVPANAFTDNFGNLVESSAATLLVRDATVPEVSSASLANDNTSVSIIFSEGVYTNATGNGALNTSDFSISFSQNGGNATDALISNILNNSGSVPAGGESELQIIINITGTPSGEESILIQPASNSSIYDVFGNALSAAENTGTLRINDKMAPSSTIDPEDGSTNILETTNIIVSYSEPLKFSDGSTVSNTSIDSLITLKNNNVNGANIAFDATMNADKDEITINPNENFSSWQSVYAAVTDGLTDTVGNATNEVTTTFRVRDATPPTMVNAILEDHNNYADLIISEGVFGNSDGTGALSADDLSITMNQNNGNASAISISSLSNTTDNQLGGGEDTIRVHLNIAGAASGDETIEISPTANSVFDVGGNILAITETSGELQLYDILVPSVDTVSLDNRSKINYNTANTIAFTFSEEITSLDFRIKARHYQSLTFSGDTSATVLTITLDPPLKALDTIDIDILEIVDNVGLSTVDLFYEFYTPAMGDYDWNDTIDIRDLANFINGWKTKDYAYELGPVTGKIPHYLPEFDSEFGLDDGMVFTQMWGWSQNNFGWGEILRPTVGSQPDWLAGPISIPEKTTSGQVIVHYEPTEGQLEVIPPHYGPDGITLTHHDEIHGKYIVEFGSFEEFPDEKQLQVLPKADRLSHMSISHIFLDQNGDVLSSGTKLMTVTTPTDYRLYPNYPNPFNPSTTIEYAVSIQGMVKIEIYDINGRLVDSLIQSEHTPGFYQVQWLAKNIASGVYFCRMTAEQKVINSKLLLIK